MSLFDKLKDTDLKSLKFGQKGTQGDSTKPYIVTDINTVDTAFNKFRLTKFDDGLIRGGAVGSLNAGITDTVRITKFLTDAPRGPLFIAKQVGLQLSNPKLEARQLPTNTFDNNTILGKVLNFGASVINKLNDAVGGPTRIYNLGVNTLAQIPLNALGGHIVRHGFLPIVDVASKYENVVASNNKNGNNRLEGYYTKLFADTDTRANWFKNGHYATLRENKISDYIGGPNSAYGIGRTTIRRTTFTGNKDEIRKSLNLVANRFSKEGKANIDNDIISYTKKDASIYKKYNADYKTLNINNKNLIKDTGSTISSLTLSSLGIKLPPLFASFVPNITSLPNNSESVKFSAANLKTSLTDIKAKINGTKNAAPTDAKLDAALRSFFKTPVTPKDTPKSTYYPEVSKPKLEGPSTPLPPISVPTGVGVPVLIPGGLPGMPEPTNTSLSLVTSDNTYNKLRGKPLNEYKKGKDVNIKAPSTNGANASYYSVASSDTTLFKDPKNLNYMKNALANSYNRDDSSIMTVVFKHLDPFSTGTIASEAFSAYMSGYSEDYNSNWNDIKYNGRAEFFYTFNSYKKTASFTLQIPIFTKAELQKKHNELKDLQNSTAGAYKDNRLGGVITVIKLGGYLDNEPCIINSLKITIPNDTSWDFVKDSNHEGKNAYAMLLEASFNITVIGNRIPGFLLQDTPVPPIKKDSEPEIPKPVKRNPVDPLPPRTINYIQTNLPQIKSIPIDNVGIVQNQAGGILNTQTGAKPGDPYKRYYDFKGFGGGQPGGGGAGSDSPF